MASACRRASSRVSTGPPLHGASGTPTFSASNLASTLSPSVRIAAGGGPMKVSFRRAQSSAKAMSSATKPQPTHTASALDSSRARSSSAWSRYGMPADVLRSVTASSAWRTNMARRSASVCRAIVVMPHPYSAFNSRTARIRRTAASPLLTTAIRLGNLTVGGSVVEPRLSRRQGPYRCRRY